MSETFTPDEVAERLGMRRAWLMRRVQRKEVPHLRMGHYVRFTEAHVQQILADATVSPAPVNDLAPTRRSQNHRRRAS